MLAITLVGVVSFLILEFGVRLLAPQPVSWLSIYRSYGRLPFFTLQPNAHEVVDTGETRWEVWTDANGRRYDPKAPVRQGATALWLGDSFTFGHGVNYEQTWIGQLDGLEHARHHHVNAGVVAYGPTQYRAVLEDLLPSMPELSLVCVATFLGNDFHDTFWEKDLPMTTGIMDDEGGFMSWIRKSLHSYRLISRVLHALAGKKTGQQFALIDLYTPENWKQEPLLEAVRLYREAFVGMAEACASHSIPLVVFVIPTPAMIREYRLHGPADSVEVADERGTLFRAMSILEGLGLRVVDTTATLAAHDPEALFFRYDGHFTPEGHRIMTDLMLKAVPEFQR